MAILYMETEVADRTYAKVGSIEQEFASKLQELSGQMDELRGNWQGNSASEFFQQYDQWRKSLDSMLSALAEMGSSLGREIEEWKAVSATFE